MAQKGPALGQSYPLQGEELVIGGAPDSQISIPDAALRRKHALIRKTARGWAVSDLGSGTLLNGDPIEDEAVLSDGDVISVGSTELLYERAGESSVGRSSSPVTRSGASAAERSTGRAGRVRTSRMANDPRAARTKRLKIFRAIGGALIVVWAALIGWKAIDYKHQNDRLEAESAGRAHAAAMAKLFGEAKALVRQGKWAEAKSKLEEIQQEDPEYESRQVQDFLKVAVTELPVQQLLAEAKEAIARGALGKARAALEKVKATSQEVAVRTVREALQASVTQKLAEAHGLADDSGDLAKMEQLAAICDELLSVQADDREVIELKKQAHLAISRIKDPPVAVARPDSPWVEVQQRFKSGDVPGALAVAQACANKQEQCRVLERNIKDFESKTKRVEDLSEAELVRLYELDQTIAGGVHSDSSGALRTQLLSKLFLKASQANGSGNALRVLELGRKILQIDPGHAGAKDLVNQATTQVNNLYLRGYQLKEANPEEAIRLFNEVIAMTPSDEEIHRKAKSRISELQK